MCSKIHLILLVYASAVSTIEMKENTLKDVYTNVMKISEKFDYLSQRIDKLEENASTGRNAMEVEDIRYNISELMKNSEKITKIEQLLMELLERTDQKRNARETKVDVVGDLTSQCNSMCESKVNEWANQTSAQFKGNLENMDFSLNNSTFKNHPKTNACDPNPCLSGGQCEPMSYMCLKCPYPTSGRHCEDLNCSKEKRCWQFKESIYVLIEEKMTWEQAYNRCENQGMRLAMPKERDATEFLVTQLKTVYQPSQGLHFWIGLRPVGGEWRWIDESPLGDYVGNWPNFKSSTDHLGTLYLHGTNMYWWPSPKTYTWYPICENRLFVRV